MARCPYPPCTVDVDADMFACRPHWFMLPRAVSGRITRAWRARLAAPRDRSAAQAHQAAKRVAVAWYEAHAEEAARRG